jgi:transposase
MTDETLDELGQARKDLAEAKEEIKRMKGRRTRITSSELPRRMMGRDEDFERQVITTSGPAKKKQQLLQTHGLKVKSAEEKTKEVLERIGKGRKK